MRTSLGRLPQRLVPTHPSRSIFYRARWRLVGLNLLVFGLLLLILGIAAYGVFNSRIFTSVDSDLRHQEERVIATIPDLEYYPPFLMSQAPFPDGYQAAFYDPSFGRVMETQFCRDPVDNLSTACNDQKPISGGALADAVKATRGKDFPYSADTPVQVAFEDLRSVSYEGQPERVLTFAVQDAGTVIAIYQVGRTVAGEASALDELKTLLLAGGVVGLLLAALASLFLAGRALVPIRQAFGRQRQFTADASHELRTPLALIRANAEMLYRHARGTDEELIGEIIRETDHLNRLVGDLLTLARADAESLTLESRPIDLRALVSSVHEDLQAIAGSRGIATEVALNGLVTVQGDEGRLRQLLLILLDNALKYTDPGGKVDVSVGRQDDRARLVVADTGIGIPAADQAHIFDRFYRVDRAREHESGGTGLGLAIAHWIVQAHHGTIRVESESGKGSRFQIDLPAAQQRT
jgi:signal transduction histidine kinase